MEHYIGGQYWCIYYHKNKINGKIYLGKTNNTKIRFGKNGSGYKRCTRFWNAISKYGWDNFEHNILITGLLEEQVKMVEAQLIHKYDLTNPNNGYNVMLGETYIPNRQLNKVYRYSLLGEYIDCWDTAFKAAKALQLDGGSIAVAALSNGKSRTGNFLWSYEKSDKIQPYIDRTRKYLKVYKVNFNGEVEEIFDSLDVIEKTMPKDSGKIRDCCFGRIISSMGYFWILEDEFSQEKILELINKKINSGGRNKSKQICMYDLDGNLLRIFLNKNDVANYTGINPSTIKNVCKGHNSNYRAGDYLWRYKEETNGDNIQPWENKKIKSILQFTKDGKFVREYDRIRNAQKIYGRSIIQSLNSKSHHSHDYLWFYKSDFEKYKKEFNLEDPHE